LFFALFSHFSAFGTKKKTFIATLLFSHQTEFVFNSNAYTMVLHKHGDFLYNGVKQTVHEHLTGVAQVRA
jgi:hypothetical protein